MNDFLIVFLLNEPIYRRLEKCITFLQNKWFLETNLWKIDCFVYGMKYFTELQTISINNWFNGTVVQLEHKQNRWKINDNSKMNELIFFFKLTTITNDE